MSEEDLLKFATNLIAIDRKIPLCSFADNTPLVIKRLCRLQPIYLIENLATEEECQHIINIGSDNLSRSTVIENMEQKISEIRTSWTGFLTKSGHLSDDPILNKILKRISCLSGYDISHFEAVNILRYTKDQKYSAHHDYFSNEFKSKAGQRIMTFLLYLNSVPEENGGATYFPELNIWVQPKAGTCVFWMNTDLEANPYPKTKHEGQPIKGDAVKWANNFWIREHNY